MKFCDPVKLQKGVIVFGVMAFILCGLFPPWLYTVNSSGGGGQIMVHSEKSAGYEFILAPPKPEYEGVHFGVRLDGLRLGIEWTCVAAGCGAVWVLFARTAPRLKLPPRIVIVDDEEDSLETADLIVRYWFKNATILKFQSGEQAWHELLLADPDLLITDWNRPGLDGRDLLTRLAERKVKYPIIVASAHAEEEHVQEFWNRGLNVKLLSKPYSMESFWGELSHLVGPSDHAETEAINQSSGPR